MDFSDQLNNYKKNISLAQFNNKKIEINFLKTIEEKNIKYYQNITFLLGSLFYLFLFADYHNITDNSIFMIIFLIRTFFLIISLFIHFKANYFFSSKRLYKSSTTYIITLLSSFLIIGYIYQGYNLMIEYLGANILILVSFFILPNKFFYQVIISTVFSFLFFYISTFKTANNTEELYAIIVYNTLTLILCIATSYRINNLQRLNFLHNLKLKEISITDPLTGIYNRLKFEQELNNEIQYFFRYNTTLSMIILDIDHFKEINDKYGHVMGDRVLVKLTKLLQTEIRDNDIFARIGGEEFAIILPRTGQKKAKALAERLRLLVEGYKFDYIKGITCSFGVTEFQGDDATDFIRKVDFLLYEAKNCGRNQVAASKS